MKATATVCTDGKRHSWKVVSCIDNFLGALDEVIWCRKCGAISERRVLDTGRTERCIDNGEIYIEFPKTIKEEV